MAYDIVIQQYCEHLLGIFRDSTCVLEDLFEGKSSASCWGGWISPGDGRNPLEGVQFNQTLLAECKRLQDSIAEHLKWIEEDSKLPSQHKKHVNYIPPDGYALFLGFYQPTNVLLADPKGKPKITRSATAALWTIGLGKRVIKLLKSLQNDFARLNKFRNRAEDEDHFLYSLPEDLRDQWESIPCDAQNFEIANLGAKRTFELHNKIVEYLGLGQDLSIIRVRLENEVDDWRDAVSFDRPKRPEVIRGRMFKRDASNRVVEITGQELENAWQRVPRGTAIRLGAGTVDSDTGGGLEKEAETTAASGVRVNETLEKLDRKHPKLDTQSGDWIRSEKQNQEIFKLSVSSLNTYRKPNNGGLVSPCKMFGVDKDGRFWRRQGTPRAHPYYLKSTLPKTGD